jgi:hypothetical protein
VTSTMFLDAVRHHVEPGKVWQPLNLSINQGSVVVARPTRAGSGLPGPRFWGGRDWWDSFSSRLIEFDPTTGHVHIAPVCVYANPHDAWSDWIDYLIDRRRRGTPLLHVLGQVLALSAIPDKGAVPPFGGSL